MTREALSFLTLFIEMCASDVEIITSFYISMIKGIDLEYELNNLIIFYKDFNQEIIDISE